MPLIRPGSESEYEPNDQHRAIGFWMTETGHQKQVSRFVRVFVTYFALWELDRSKVADVPSAEELFGVHRAMIEQAANAKFDARGLDDEEFEGRPVLTLREPDLPLIEIA